MSGFSALLRPQDGAFRQFNWAMAMLLAAPKGVASDSISGRLIMEAMSRLSQLDYLRTQTMESEDIVGRLVRAVPWSPAIAATTKEAMFRCQLYAEAFYLFAFRVFDITRIVNKDLFGKAKVCPEPRGVREVRNDLIIHPTGSAKQPVLNRSFTVSMEDGRGVVLKSQRLPGEGADPVDAGFRSNAAEFQVFIGRWIAKVGGDLNIFTEEF